MTLGSKINTCALFFFHASMNNSMDRLFVYASNSKMSVHSQIRAKNPTHIKASALIDGL